MKTPTNRKSHGDGVEQEKTSGKKLVQARLPFKILPTPEVKVVKESAEVRKRRLSYEEEDTTKTVSTPQSTKRRSLRNCDNPNAKKRKEIINRSATKKAIVANVVLSDSDDGGADASYSGCKENLKTAEKQNLSTKIGESSDVLSDDVELIESTDEDEKVTEKSKAEAVISKTDTSKKSITKTVTATPVSNIKSTQKDTRKSTTPQSANKSKGKGRKSAGDTKSASKLQIKLPISNKKNKRRKQAKKGTETTTDEQDMHDEMSDDVEVISKELHPEKRQKLDIPSNDEKEIDEISERNEQPKEKANVENSSKNQAESTKKSSTASINPVRKELESEDVLSESDQNKSKTLDISSTTSDLEADNETENTVNSEKFRKTKTEKNSNEANVIENTASPKIAGDSSVHKIQKNNLTPKQQKLHEQRLKAREEKERKIQEERLQKQREKEERELSKKREREEKEEQRRKEREEREDQRRKEREEKERKRLADIEVKNEEKRRRTEAKEEEHRKKEEERKRKEQEKEEFEMKKKKAALAFTKFFSRPVQDTTGLRTGEKDATEENHDLLAFRPFQIKGDMKLAPVVRKKLSDEEREQLDTFVEGECSGKSYLIELKCGTIKPYKWSPPSQNDSETIESKKGKDDDDDDDDVVVVEDELERAGQAIFEEHYVPIERFRAKFYKFAENRRPPYFGTWRKKSKIITPRRPFRQDKQFFDYEVDSDDEWEDEEPGESLDGSDDEKEKESEDEDYEVDNDWFVPHGHLSEEEMQNEDDLGENNDREAQKAKLKILQQEFAQEMKKKTEKIKPRLIGCIWVDENGNQPELCPKIIWGTLNMRATLCAEPPIMEEIKSTTEKNGEINTANGQTGEKTNGEIKLKPIKLTESMLRQLVKLVHGNTHSRNFLIKEFIAYIEANEESVRNGDVRGPLKSAVREKIDEFAQWQVVETISKKNESTKDNKSNKTPKNKKKLCWVASKDILQNMNLEMLDLNNNWEYILPPRVHRREAKQESTASNAIANEDSNDHSETSVDQCNVASGNATDPATPILSKSTNPDIKKFTKLLTAEEKAQQLQNKAKHLNTPSTKETASSSTIKSTPNSNIATSKSVSQTPNVKKRVPLLISVARGESISTPDKNARVSQFLKTINDAKQKEKEKNDSTTTPMETDDIISLE